MKIVVGIDDSPHSDAALEWVKSLRWPPGSRIVLVAAVPIQAVSVALGSPSGAMVPPLLDERGLEVARALTAGMRVELKHAGIVATEVVEYGDARDLILRTAASEGADLIVVGSHGRTGLPRLLMGSVASHVVTHAPCAVLVVKRAAMPPAHG